MSAIEKTKRRLLGIEIPRDELAVRLLEASIGASRPKGMTPSQALADAESLNPDLADSFRRQADAAVLYFHQCIQAGTQPS